VPALQPGGILLVDKPEGWTSHDVVAFLRPILGTRRVGHTGTLDPLASGLLVVVYGRATKLAAELHAARKTYLADVSLGTETTTDDREGETAASAPVPALSDESVRRALATFLGPQAQVPPAYSAVHVRGTRAYVRARRGETTALGPRQVEFYALELIAREPSRLRLRVECSAGTYIRALARDLGRTLGTRAHLAGLRRLMVGPFTIDGALTPEQVRQLGTGGLAERVVPEDAARRLLAATLSDQTRSAAQTSMDEGNQASR
jgi:tRNA pseudouridine55 synthase